MCCVVRYKYVCKAEEQLAMQYKTVYKHKRNAVYYMYAPVCYAYEGYAQQFSDNPIVYETHVLRVLVRANTVYVDCCSALSEIASVCSTMQNVVQPVLAALNLHNYTVCNNVVYGTNDGGCFIVLHKQ